MRLYNSIVSWLNIKQNCQINVYLLMYTHQINYQINMRPYSYNISLKIIISLHISSL